MSHCTSCGKPLTPGLAFCTACGATIPVAVSLPPATPMEGAPLAPARASIDASAVVAGSFRLVFRHFGAFLRTQGLFILAGALVGLAILILYVRPATGLMMGGLQQLAEDPESVDLLAYALDMLPMLGWMTASGVVTVLFGLAGAGFGIVAADLLRVGERATLGTVWAKLRPRLGNYVATALLVRLGIAGVLGLGFLLFFLVLPVVAGIVAAIYLYLRWALAAPASLFGSESPRANLKRSAQLTKGARGDLFVIALVALAVSVIPGIIVGSLAGFGYTPASAYELPPLWVDVVRWAAGVAAQLVSAFFLSAAFVEFYRRITA